MKRALPIASHRTIIIASILLCIITLAAARAQAGPTYEFAQESGTYAELENATHLPITFGDSLFRLDLEGEVFTFFRRPFTIAGASSFEIAGNGFLRVWDDSMVTVIDGLFMTLDTVDAASEISYLLEGTPGDRVLKVQWRRAGFPNGLEADFANFQIWVYQRTGVIEIRTGPSDVKGPEAFGTGPWIGAFIAPVTFASMGEKLWITGDPAKPVIDRLKNLQFKRVTGVPPSGTIYRMTPTSASGVEGSDAETGSIEIAPMPARDYVDVRVPSANDADIEIMDMSGSVVMEAMVRGGMGRIDISGLPAGVFMMRINDGQRVVSRKIVKG
jgi:Secretion system C-terminal sorting domain